MLQKLEKLQINLSKFNIFYIPWPKKFEILFFIKITNKTTKLIVNKKTNRTLDSQWKNLQLNATHTCAYDCFNTHNKYNRISLLHGKQI